MVRPGEKISKIKNPFVNAFSNLKKIQFRYVVNLLHKTSIDKGGVQKWSKFKIFCFDMFRLTIHTILGGGKLGFPKSVFFWTTLGISEKLLEEQEPSDRPC